jgi:hypothetical protein
MPTNPTTEVSDAGRRLDLVSKPTACTGCSILGAILPFAGNASMLHLSLKSPCEKLFGTLQAFKSSLRMSYALKNVGLFCKQAYV